MPAPRSTSPSVASASHARLPVVMPRAAGQPSSAFASSASGMPMNCLGCASSGHLLQRAPVDAGIDQHRHRAGEQRKHRQEKLGRRPRHRHPRGCRGRCRSRRAGGDGVAASVAHRSGRPRTRHCGRGSVIDLVRGRSCASRAARRRCLQGSLMPPLSPTMRAISVDTLPHLRRLLRYLGVKFHWIKGRSRAGRRGAVRNSPNRCAPTNARHARHLAGQPRCIALDRGHRPLFALHHHDRRPSVCALVPAS